MNLRRFLKRLAPLGTGLFAAALWAGDVAISDGQNAENVAGQMDGGGNPVYTQWGPYNSVNLYGMNKPFDVDLDTTSHRLFVLDWWTHRVLEYDLDSSNAIVDRTPDHVIGQLNFTSVLWGTTQRNLYFPIGAHFDPASNRLFVGDQAYNRVMIFDVASITDGENAVNVLGQSNFTSSTAATTKNGMNSPQGLYFDSLSSRLFVSDTNAHRVLVFDLTVVTDGENAVNVLGQTDFTSGTNGATINRLTYPRHLAFNPSLSQLFVAEYDNNRVTIFDVTSITDGENAINVLGQTDFTSTSAGVAQNLMSGPFGPYYDSKNQRLFVADTSNNRILVFDMTSITDGENAVNVLGQATYTTNSARTTIDGMYHPRALALDEITDQLFVADHNNFRTTVFNVSTTSIANGENAQNVVGQTDGFGGPVYTSAGIYDGAAQNGLYLPTEVVIDTVSHRLFMTDSNSHRVLEYDLDTSNTLVDRHADHVLGQPDFLLARDLVNQNSLASPLGLAFDPMTNRLFVSHPNRNRVMVFDVASITDGENAINVLGQTNFTLYPAATSQGGMRGPNCLFFQAGAALLYVADTSNHRVLVYDVASITNGENAVNVLGQADFTTGSYATTQNRMYNPRGIAHDGGTRLFVGDVSNNRVLVFDTTSISDGENAINVLGQTTFTTSTLGITQGNFRYPYGLALDQLGNRLFVGDTSNHRVVVFDVASITDGENAVNVLGQSNFTASSSGSTQNTFYNPRGLSFDVGMNRLYIADQYNHRVIVQSAGPVSPSTSTLTAVPSSVTGKIDLSWPSAGDDGAFNALTGYYRIQYATYTATWSTSTTPANAVTSTITATGVTPGVVQSTTIAGLTSGATYYFALFTADDVPNWSGVSNTASAVGQSSVTVTEMGSQPGWIGRGETQRILGTAQVVADTTLGVTISSVAVRETGSYTADSNFTNVEVWVSSSGYIDANAVRLENTAKAFSSDAAVFTQNVTVSTTPLYFIARCDVGGSATEGTFDVTMQVYTTGVTVNNPVAFTNATDVVAPPSGAPSGLSATAEANLLRVNLSWGGSTGADCYTIYRATHSGVSTSDFLIGMSGSTSFADDYVPPNQDVYYAVKASNRAGATALGAVDGTTSADVLALTVSNIYLRAGIPKGFGDGQMAQASPSITPAAVVLDKLGNVYVANTLDRRIRMIPRVGGTYFGQAMTPGRAYTIAGNGTEGYLGDGSAATATSVNSPYGIGIDGEGNIYIADTSNNRIRMVPAANGTYFGQNMTTGNIYTIAGNGTAGFVADNVAATVTQIGYPRGVTTDGAGNVYIADYNNHRIRFIPKTSGTFFAQNMTANYIFTIAGNGTSGYLADNVAATSTRVSSPEGVSVDASGSIYIADSGNSRIRFVPKTSGQYFGQSMTANYIYTIAGNGTAGYLADDVAATGTRVNLATNVRLDERGNLYIADKSNNRVRMVPRVSGTFFGQSMTAYSIYTIAGDGVWDYQADGVDATSTSLREPFDVGLDGAGNVFVGDYLNNRVRMIPRESGEYFGREMTANYIYSLAGISLDGYNGEGKLSTECELIFPEGLAKDPSGNLYFSDTEGHRVRMIPKTNGSYFGQSMTANRVYTIAGTGSEGYSGDDEAATVSQLNYPFKLAVDPDGNILIADSSNHRIRVVAMTSGTHYGQSMTANYIYTMAGNGTDGYTGDNESATGASLNQPYDVQLDPGGNVMIVDNTNHRIRMVPNVSGTYFGQSMTANYIYTIAGNGSGGYSGDDESATNSQINSPSGIAADGAGNIYIADQGNFRIRMVPRTSGTYFGQSMTANSIYTVAGNGTDGYLGDDVAATGTRIGGLAGVAVDGGGNLYMADSVTNRVRMVPRRSGTFYGQSMDASSIYTIAGEGGAEYDGENAPATGKSVYSPFGLLAGADHCLYVAEYTSKIRMIAGEDFIQPSTSTLAVTTGVEQATLSWASAGDDNVNLGNLTGTYRIQYATFTAAWSTASTPNDATTVTIATTNVVPGSARSYTVTGLTAGPTYYFVLWSGDEVPNWSDISNTTSTIVLAPIRSVTITAGNVLALGSVMMGDQVVGGTGTVVMNDGTLLNTYVLRASTLTVGTPWQVMASTPAGPDQLVFYGVFDGASAPDLGNFDVDDVVGPDDRVSTSAQFSVAGSTTGASVPAGESRTLWIRLDAPTTTTTMAGQTMRIEITAQPP